MNEFLSLAKDTAVNAGKLLKTRYKSLLVVESDKGHDIKLKADKSAEELIRHQLTIQSSFPVLGEEMGFHGTFTDFSGIYWIVDPLDGTANYMKGSNSCCVSIALWKGQQPKLGVIYNFFTNENSQGCCILPENSDINVSFFVLLFCCQWSKSKMSPFFVSTQGKSDTYFGTFIVVVVGCLLGKRWDHSGGF